MKKLISYIPVIALGLLSACALNGCTTAGQLEKVVRLVPENKDFSANVTTLYGTIRIESRVNPQGTSAFGPLPSVTASGVDSRSTVSGPVNPVPVVVMEPTNPIQSPSAAAPNWRPVYPSGPLDNR